MKGSQIWLSLIYGVVANPPTTTSQNLGKKKKRKKNLVCLDTIGHAPEPKLPKEYDKTTQHVQLVRLTRFF
jgi:hypothetical protein